MKSARIIVRRRVVSALMLTLTLTLAGSIAQATPIPTEAVDGSIVVSAYWGVINGTDLSYSTTFTPHAPTQGTLFLANGTGDLALLPAYFTVPAPPLDITIPPAWTFGSPDWTWTTFTRQVIDPIPGDGYIDFLLTGAFTPEPLAKPLDDG